MIIIDEHTNAELEEMGIPLPCECPDTTVEDDGRGNPYRVCEHCGFAVPLSEREATTW